MKRILQGLIALLTLLHFGTPFACTVIKDMPFKGCMEYAVPSSPKGVVKISTNTSEYGVISGANILNGGTLLLFGMSMGDISVSSGAKLIVKGGVSGTVTNQGGTVEVDGTVSTVIANSGTTVISGNVNILKGEGKVEYRKGAFVNGKPIR